MRSNSTTKAQCVNCENEADAFRFCTVCLSKMTGETRKALVATDGQSYLAALGELEDLQKGQNDRGYVNGRPYWETFYQAPASRDCTVKLQYTGVMSLEALEQVIRVLEAYRTDWFGETKEREPGPDWVQDADDD